MERDNAGTPPHTRALAGGVVFSGFRSRHAAAGRGDAGGWCAAALQAQRFDPTVDGDPICGWALCPDVCLIGTCTVPERPNVKRTSFGPTRHHRGDLVAATCPCQSGARRPVTDHARQVAKPLALDIPIGYVRASTCTPGLYEEAARQAMEFHAAEPEHLLVNLSTAQSLDFIAAGACRARRSWCSTERCQSLSRARAAWVRALRVSALPAVRICHDRRCGGAGYGSESGDERLHRPGLSALLRWSMLGQT